jgi:hypothetical protein
MQASRLVRCGLLGALVAWVAPAWAGWVIEEGTKGEPGLRQQILTQANRMKYVSLGSDGKPTTAFILDLDGSTITQVDHEARQFSTAPVEEYVRIMRESLQAATGQMAEAMRQMQEQMRQLPPEQRRMMEEMLRSQRGQLAPTPRDCAEPRLEFRRTGQQATIAGYPAVRYDMLLDGQPYSEVWIAPTIGAWRELDRGKLERFGAEMAKLSGCEGAQGRRGLLGGQEAWRLAAEGYPVRTVLTGSGGITIEVLKAETRTIPAAEFLPPAGFARKTLREVLGQ